MRQTNSSQMVIVGLAANQNLCLINLERAQYFTLFVLNYCYLRRINKQLVSIRRTSFKVYKPKNRNYQNTIQLQRFCKSFLMIIIKQDVQEKNQRTLLFICRYSGSTEQELHLQKFYSIFYFDRKCYWISGDCYEAIGMKKSCRSQKFS
ncbi:unnamed protein product [Paramecium octaurelia]|uniref:Uncharacterized protein n=1 Tax=Paramecium octaurelia TaxID=43137 RepID=A0A8S1W683_PAROT|nr:unnamed protein product [Paramecium octaurelia]